jgi:hypothetical protein
VVLKWLWWAEVFLRGASYSFSLTHLVPEMC